VFRKAPGRTGGIIGAAASFVNRPFGREILAPEVPLPWSGWLGADPCHFAARRLLQCIEKLRNQGAEISEAIRSRAQHNNRDRKARKVLLVQS